MLFLLIILALVTYYVFTFYQKRKTLPPGPFPLPFVGNVINIGFGVFWYGNVINTMKEWHKKYGPVVTWYIGPIPTFHIGEHQLAVETMIKHGGTYVDRYKIPIMEIGRRGRGVIFSNGQHWQEQRRFALRTLRNFGLGRNIMQDRIMNEYNLRTGTLNKQIEEGGGSLNFDPHHFIEKTVGNIINRMLFSQGFTEEMEHKFFSLKEELDKIFDNPSLMDFFLMAETAWLPGFKQRMNRYVVPIEAVLNFLGEQVAERRKAIANGDHILREEGEDFVDAFFIEMEKSDAAESFSDGTLAVTLLDLWTAGQETTTTTLYWALNYLLLNPEVVLKLQKELDQVTGKQRHLELSDKPNTPYLNAIILETLRVSSLLPINILRETSEETKIGDFLLPKGSAVNAELSIIMADAKVFPEPEKFKPERFLDGNAEQSVVPFGLGKRACLGESLARAELYLILGNLSLFYNFATDPLKRPQMEAASDVGGVRKARRYNTIVSKRIL